MYKLVIFDMDGTLVDSVSKWAELFEETLHHYNIIVPRDHLISTFGRSAPDTIRLLVPNGNAKPATEYFLNHQKEYIEKFQAFPHVEKTLKYLKSKGFFIAVATGNNRHLMHFFLDKFGLSQYMDFLVCAQDVKYCKPNPEMLFKALEHFKLRPDEALYIADSPIDFLAAKSAHIRIGLVATGVLSIKQALILRPDYVLENLGDLEKLL